MQTLEERKQELRENLKKTLIKRNIPSLRSIEKPFTSYESTWSIANTWPYYHSTNEIFIVKNHWRNAVGGMLIIAFITCPLVFFEPVRKNIIFYAFFALLVWAGARQIIFSLDKRIKLLIDKKGIFYYEWKEYIEWKNIIATYIKEYADTEGETLALVIFFHNKDDAFEQKLIQFEELKTNPTELSYFIEYLKMKAGFPTKPEHYS